MPISIRYGSPGLATKFTSACCGQLVLKIWVSWGIKTLIPLENSISQRTISL